MTKQPDIRPWDRQNPESAKAYEAFCIYRDMGPDRTLRAVAEVLNKSQAIMGRWSSAHDWPARSRAWDSMPGRKLEEAYEEQAKRTAQAHQRLADKLVSKLERNLDLLPEGTDPSIRWSTAAGAARQSHQLSNEMSKPQGQIQEELSKQIGLIISRLAGDD